MAKTFLQKFQAYLDDDADAETKAEVAGQLKHPDDPVLDLMDFCGAMKGLRAEVLARDGHDLDNQDDEDENEVKDRRPTSDLQKLQAYLDGSADPEIRAEIEAQLKEPDNQFDAFLKGCRERSLPGPAFFGGFPPDSGINYFDAEEGTSVAE